MAYSDATLDQISRRFDSWTLLRSSLICLGNFRLLLRSYPRCRTVLRPMQDFLSQVFNLDWFCAFIWSQILECLQSYARRPLAGFFESSAISPLWLRLDANASVCQSEAFLLERGFRHQQNQGSFAWPLSKKPFLEPLQRVWSWIFEILKSATQYVRGVFRLKTSMSLIAN